MRLFDPRPVFAASLVLAVLGIAALFIGVPQPVVAQFASQGTWIPASGVGGSANAVTLAVPNVASMSDLLGVPLRFKPGTTNAAGGTTINVDSFGDENVLRSSDGLLVAIAGGDFTAGSTAPFAEVIWDGAEFVQKNPATGDDAVGTERVLTNTATPAGWLTEDGSCVSRTTYAALFAYYGSTDLWATQAGSSCGGTQFTLPKANGRVAVAANNQGAGTGPLTNCTAGVANNCGAQNQALSSTSQLPQFTPSGSVSVSGSISGTANAGNGNTLQNGSGGGTGINGSGPGVDTTTYQPTVSGSSFSWSGGASFSGNAVGSASPSSFSIVNPNYQVLKVVKY